jgi:hypothetical protein
MSNSNSELATAVANVVVAAQKAGLPLEIKVGVSFEGETVSLSPLSLPNGQRLTEMDEKLLRQLALAPTESLTLTDFAAAIDMDENEARAAMRGAGRSALSVKDDLYERFDTPRSEGGKVRTYRLTIKGRDFVKAL